MGAHPIAGALPFCGRTQCAEAQSCQSKSNKLASVQINIALYSNSYMPVRWM